MSSYFTIETVTGLYDKPGLRDANEIVEFINTVLHVYIPRKGGREGECTLSLFCL